MIDFGYVISVFKMKDTSYYFFSIHCSLTCLSCDSISFEGHSKFAHLCTYFKELIFKDQ
jgi:hypothetical protein